MPPRTGMEVDGDRCGSTRGAEQWPQHRVDDVVDDCYMQRWDRVGSALDAGFPVNATGGRCGASLLHWAACHGHVPIVRRLLAAGAHANICDVFQRTPTLFAACCTCVDGLAALVEAGADVNACDSELQSPLFWAVACSLPCTRYLLSLPQVELYAVNRYNKTAEQHAREFIGSDISRVCGDVVRAEVCVRVGGACVRTRCCRSCNAVCAVTEAKPRFRKRPLQLVTPPPSSTLPSSLPPARPLPFPLACCAIARCQLAPRGGAPFGQRGCRQQWLVEHQGLAQRTPSQRPLSARLVGLSWLPLWLAKDASWQFESPAVSLPLPLLLVSFLPSYCATRRCLPAPRGGAPLGLRGYKQWCARAWRSNHPRAGPQSGTPRPPSHCGMCKVSSLSPRPLPRGTGSAPESTSPPLPSILPRDPALLRTLLLG